KNLALINDLHQFVINGTSASQVPSQRLFHNDACLRSLTGPGDESGVLQLLHTGDNQLWRDGEIKYTVAWNAEFIFDLAETLLKGCKDGGILEGAWHVEQRPRKI